MYSTGDWIILATFPLSDSYCNRMTVSFKYWGRNDHLLIGNEGSWYSKAMNTRWQIYSVYLYKQDLLFRNLLLLSATSLATLTYLSSSQNFPRASDLNECMNPLLPVPFKLREFDSLRRKAYTWKLSSLRWPIYIIKLVDKTKLFCNTLHWRSITVSTET